MKIAIARELGEIVGKRYVLHGDPASVQNYAHDEVAGREHAHTPEAVVKPMSAEESSEILQLASRERMPV